MGDENDINDSNRRRRPIPVPLYSNDRNYDYDRYIERPYLKKHELAKIRDNLDVLVDIKDELLNKNLDKSIDKSNINNIKKENSKELLQDINIPNVTIVSPPNTDNVFNSDTKHDTKSNVKSNTKSDIKAEIKNDSNKEPKKDDIKIGISNLIDNKQTDNKQIRNKQKIIKRKVIRMDEIESNIPQYNLSPEDRRRLRKSEIKEFQDEEETSKAVRKAANLAEQTATDLANLREKLRIENEKMKEEIKNEFSNKIGQIDHKFSEKLDNTHKKLEETCTGIECLKNDFKLINEKSDLAECPECEKKIVPKLSSFCPGCAARIKGWTENDGTPVRGWKPSWKKDN